MSMGKVPERLVEPGPMSSACRVIMTTLSHCNTSVVTYTMLT